VALARIYLSVPKRVITPVLPILIDWKKSEKKDGGVEAVSIPIKEPSFLYNFLENCRLHSPEIVSSSGLFMKSESFLIARL